MLLRDIAAHGLLAAYTVLLAVWAGDAAAYFIGFLFGRHKLAPTVSPGKTGEGLIAGTAATIARHVHRAVQVEFPLDPRIACARIVIAVAAPLGDLFESAIKRDMGVKDSGRLLGGHGGLLDRLDALLFSWVAAYYVIAAFGQA